LEQLIIKANTDTPEINFDGEKGVFSIIGKSYPENTGDFYDPLIEYIELYKLNPKVKTSIEFNWFFYNTATSKVIVRIIMLLKDLSKEFEVKWFCYKDNDLLIEKGMELKEILDVNFNITYL
jgi:hypothetical protein